MADLPNELRETWVKRGDRVVAEGDSAAIDEMLADELTQAASADDGWRILYRHRGTGRYWELTYPDSALHGGGPRLLRQLDLDDPAGWR